jgi:hypothetical protein
MPHRRPFHRDVEFDEAVEQRPFPVQMWYREARFAFGLAFQQSKPQQRPQDERFNGEWAGM